ncbi:uncharacterized protein FIBRA_02727 [Fibroporia radiculosa]|uniref:Beta-xylanase n=1 Tax=Fibroporia radiculosa TaxID=599839 RepID=J4G2H9_9APHY|nr:uncharacterized protein FIBRA_02727 [Fibroporia radiculosa]CCM00688.1 predicted protein [Fibroporia radiculosa]
MAFFPLLAVLATSVSLRTVTALPQTASATTAALPTATAVVPGLNYLARNTGKLYFGTATDNPELNDTTYTGILENYLHFGQITPANSMKWDAIEPEPGVFTFEAGDVIAELARSNGMILRDVWDVINEPLNDDGTMREDVFYDTLGTSYIEIALRTARAADPTVKLYINDYNIEYVGNKSTAMQNLIKELQANDVPIDGVGLESHFIVGEVPTTLVENMQNFAALGIEFAITELDIRMELPETPELLEQQKSDFYTVVSACLAVPQCVGVTVWDWTDKYSWIPSSFPGWGAATPWDADFVRKPAFDGIALAFEGQPV